MHKNTNSHTEGQWKWYLGCPSKFKMKDSTNNFQLPMISFILKQFQKFYIQIELEDVNSQISK